MINSVRNSLQVKKLYPHIPIEPIIKQPLNVHSPKIFIPQPHTIKFNQNSFHNNVTLNQTCFLATNPTIISKRHIRYFSSKVLLENFEKLETPKTKRVRFFKMILISSLAIGGWAFFRDTNSHIAATEPLIQTEDNIQKNRALVEELLLENKNILEKHVKLMDLYNSFDEKNEYLIICDQQIPLSLPVNQFQLRVKNLCNSITNNKLYVETFKNSPFWNCCSDSCHIYFKINDINIIWYANDFYGKIINEHYKYLLLCQDYQKNLDIVKKDLSRIFILNEQKDITKTTMRHIDCSEEFNLFMTTEKFNQQLNELLKKICPI